MAIVIKVVIEIVLALTAVFAGTMVWGVRQKNKFLIQKANDQDFLDEFVDTLQREKPFSERAKDIEPLGYGYFENIALVTQATSRADRSLQRLGVLLLAAILILSYFLGVWSVAVNVMVFILVSFIPLSEAQVRNALTSILEAAQILYKWNEANPGECQELMEETQSLKKIHKAIKRINR